jgi:SAM-dependent methyltransferase
MLKVIEKSWSDFWAAYWQIDHRHRIPEIFEWDRQLVDFIEAACKLHPDGRILDLGCGGGDQAKVFARKGYGVVGMDIAPSLIEFARRQFKKERLKGKFLVGDMRKIKYREEFDACLLLSGTFGFFGDDEDQKLLSSIHRALKVGGKAFIMFLSPRQQDKNERFWSEIEDGWELSEAWFDAETSTYRSRIFIIKKDGTLVRPKDEPGYHAEEAIRCYTIPEMRAMLAGVGLKYLASYSSKDLSLPPRPPAPEAERNIVVAARSRRTIMK